MGQFDADYHETEEAFPLVYNLGRASLEWNMVEHFFTTMVWELLGDYRTGMAVTSGMGNISKADVVLRLSRERLREADTLDAIEFACKAFNILRENRNMLVHSHSIFRGENGGKPHWRRSNGKKPEGHVSAEADFADLERLIAEICTLGFYVGRLAPFLHRRRRKHWPNKIRPAFPDKFPLPSLLLKSSEVAETKVKRSSGDEKKEPKQAKKANKRRVKPK